MLRVNRIGLMLAAVAITAWSAAVSAQQAAKDNLMTGSQQIYARDFASCKVIAVNLQFREQATCHRRRWKTRLFRTIDRPLVTKCCPDVLGPFADTL